MSYTKAQIAAIGQELATASGGLIPAPVGAAWASAEQGINNNVFGLGASHAGVPGYSSTTAAVQATWHQMTSSGVYAATISRLQAAGGNVGKAALAIAESPWHLGAAGVKAAGGVDPYYARVFTQAGIPVSTTGGAPAPSTGGSSGGGTWGTAGSTVTMPALNIATGHVLNAGDVLGITQTLTAAGWFPGFGGAHSAGAAYLDGLAGQVWSPALSAQIAAKFAASPASGAGAVPLVDSTVAAIAALPGQLVGFVAPVAVLIALLWIGKVGLQKTLG